eukprot:Sdes_comp10336_c0_seq2m1980
MMRKRVRFLDFEEGKPLASYLEFFTTQPPIFCSESPSKSSVCDTLEDEFGELNIFSDSFLPSLNFCHSSKVRKYSKPEVKANFPLFCSLPPPNLSQNVALESLSVDFPDISAFIRVRNIDYQKTVFLRCSLDGWKTFYDKECSFLRSQDIEFDIFSFHQQHFLDRSKTQFTFSFAIGYKVNNIFHWDNNSGNNFSISISKPSKNDPLSSSAKFKSSTTAHSPLHLFNSDSMYIMNPISLGDPFQPSSTPSNAHHQYQLTATEFSYDLGIQDSHIDHWNSRYLKTVTHSNQIFSY